MILIDLETREETIGVVDDATVTAVYAAATTDTVMGNTYATILDAVDDVLDATLDALEDR